MDGKEDVEIRQYDLWISDRRRRFRVVTMVAPGTLGLILLVIRLVFEKMIYDRGSIAFVLWYLTNPLVVIILFMMTALMTLMIYLQTGFKRKTQDESSMLRYESQLSELLRLRNRSVHKESGLTSEIEDIKKELSLINSKIKKTPEIMDEDQKQNLIAHLKEELTEATASEVLEEVKEQANRRFAVEAWIGQVSAQFEDSVRRLNAEVSAQGRRGNLNLVLGIVTTVSGLVLLGYFVIKIEPSKAEANYVDFMRYFIPRLSLVGFVELFAYFFLRLYKASLAEIKYFQNELTNIESKAIALGAALNTQKESTISDTIISLSNTERNRILQKGETTPELESAKIEAGSISDIAKEVVALVKKHRE